MDDFQPVIDVRHIGAVAVVRLTREELLSDADIRSLDESINPLLDQEAVPSLVLDFSCVRAVSSSALGFLITLRKRVTERNGRLKLCAVEKKVTSAANDKYVYEIFKIVQLDKFFEIHDTVEEALKSLSGSTTGS